MNDSNRSAISLEALPELVLDRICDYLAHAPLRKRHLSAFSLTSRRCSVVAARHRYRVVELTLPGEWEEPVNAIEWNALQDRQGCWRHIRILVVQTSRGRYKAEEASEVSFGDDDLDPLGIDAVCMRGHRGESKVPCRDVMWPEFEEKFEREWGPLAEMVERLPGLRDFVWCAPGPFPVCVLERLHEASRARVHVETFWFRSLCAPNGSIDTIGRAEMALATSPLLHRIVVVFDGRGQGHNRRIKEAVLQMIAGAALNLREVTLRNDSEYDPFQDTEESARPAPIDFFPRKSCSTDVRQPRRGKLTSLAFAGDYDYNLSSEELETWDRITQLEHLTHLELPQRMKQKTLRRLLEMLDAGAFPSLQHISFSGRLYTQPQYHRRDPPAFPYYRDILQATVPLRSLTLHANLTYLDIEPILGIHGPHLHRLRFSTPQNPIDEPVAVMQSARDVESLATLCPNIDELQVSISRTFDDPFDVITLRAFRLMARMRRLTLGLAARPRLLRPPSAGSDSRPLGSRPADSEYDVEDALKRAAVNSALALSIFEEVAGETRNSKLERVAVVPLASSMSPPLPGHIVDVIAKGWECVRDPPGGDVAGIVVSLLPGRFSRVHDIHYAKDLREETDAWARFWRKLWPPGDCGWREQWRSVPLARSEDPERGSKLWQAMLRGQE